MALAEQLGYGIGSERTGRQPWAPPHPLPVEASCRSSRPVDRSRLPASSYRRGRRSARDRWPLLRCCSAATSFPRASSTPSKPVPPTPIWRCPSCLCWQPATLRAWKQHSRPVGRAGGQMRAQPARRRAAVCACGDPHYVAPGQAHDRCRTPTPAHPAVWRGHGRRGRGGGVPLPWTTYRRAPPACRAGLLLGGSVLGSAQPAASAQPPLWLQATERGVWCSNIPSSQTPNALSTAEMAVFLTLGLLRRAREMQVPGHAACRPTSVETAWWLPSLCHMLLPREQQAAAVADTASRHCRPAFDAASLASH